MKIGGNIKDGNQVENSRAVLKGSHCQFINLCAVDTMALKGCSSGQKFVVKA